MSKFLKTLWKDEKGASAAEYAVLLTLITAVLIGLVATLGSAIGDVFNAVSATLSTHA